MNVQRSVEKLVILDRDGVINVNSDFHIRSPDEWQAIPYSLESIAQLNRAGYRIAVASNQSGLAKGLFDRDILQAIHHKMHTELAKVGGHIERVFFCPHTDQDNCACRKPRSGLLLDIAEYFNISLKNVYMVGDSACDIQAARSAGAQPILVLTGRGQITINDTELIEGVPIYENLAAFVNDFLNEEQNH